MATVGHVVSKWSALTPARAFLAITPYTFITPPRTAEPHALHGARVGLLMRAHGPVSHRRTRSLRPGALRLVSCVRTGMHKASGATFGHALSRWRPLAKRDPWFHRGVALQRHCGAPSGTVDLAAQLCLLHALRARPCGLARAACARRHARCWSWLGFLESWRVVGKPAARKAAAVAFGALHTQPGRPVAHVAQCNSVPTLGMPRRCAQACYMYVGTQL